MEPVTVLDTIFKGVQVGAGILSDVMNYKSQWDTRKYQEDVQKKTWEREDNAVRRRTADLRAAGLNPILAAGSAASTSQPIQVGTPQLSAGNTMHALEALQARKQMAVTDAQLQLLAEQRRKTGYEADAAAYEARRTAAESYLPTQIGTIMQANPQIGGAIINGTIENMIARLAGERRSSEDIVRNSDIRRNLGTPTDSSAIDQYIANTKMLNDASGKGKGGNVILSALLALLGGNSPIGGLLK